MELNKFNVENLNQEELIRIDGGGERYAYFFGRTVRKALATALGGPVAGLFLEIYDTFS